MRKFVRKRDVVSTRMSPHEISILRSLCQQLGGLLAEAVGDPGVAPAAESDDPFAQWARELAVGSFTPELPDDPAVRRLFPNPYPHDERAATDFRRFTARDQRDRKLIDLDVVTADLDASDNGAQPVRIVTDHVGAWLRTLTSMRLVVAARLGITDSEVDDELREMPDSDPRAFMYSVYQWLGFAQETLVTALE